MLEEITQKTLKKMGITLVYLFGSSVTGTQREDSDVDIAVLTERTTFSGDYLPLQEELYVLWSNVFPEREIDLVFLERAPLSLQFEIVTMGKILFSEPSDLAYTYKERVLKFYIDFQPLLEEQNQRLLERL